MSQVSRIGGRLIGGALSLLLPANAISAFTVAKIEYYAQGLEMPTPAAALSYPPNAYHRPEDYPARNSVLLVAKYHPSSPIPDAVGTTPLSHELGHMLLNHGGHPIGLGPDGSYSDEECAVMQQNLTTLYGEEQVVDPGRPGD